MADTDEKMFDATGADLLTELGGLESDMMPNDGEAFQPTEVGQVDEVQQEADREKSMVRASSPIINELLAWFDNEIAATDSVAAVFKVAKEKNMDRDEVLIAFKIVADLLQDKKQSLITLQELYIPHTVEKKKK
jgi:hypothetical protein